MYFLFGSVAKPVNWNVYFFSSSYLIVHEVQTTNYKVASELIMSVNCAKDKVKGAENQNVLLSKTKPPIKTKLSSNRNQSNLHGNVD